MSSTNRNAERRPADFYETPAWCVHRLLEALPLPGGLWFEPCAGDGAIIKAVNEVRDDVSWHAHELREECDLALHGIARVEHVEIGDLLARPTFPSAKVAITNPPFSLAKEMVEHLINGDFEHLIMLQRLNWCGAERADLFRELKPSVYVLPDRPSFTGGGSDSIEYGWWVFDGEGKLRILKDTPDAVRREEKKRAAAKSVAPVPMTLHGVGSRPLHILGTPHEHTHDRESYCTVCQDETT